MTSVVSGQSAAQRPSQHPKQDTLDELEVVHDDLRRLVETMSKDDLGRKTIGTRWTNRELLFHMLFGYLIVRALLWYCVVMSRFTPGTTRLAAALLDSRVSSLNWINFVASVMGGRLFTPARMVATMDHATRTLERRLRNASDDLLSHAMYYPMTWDPFFRQYMTIADLYHYPTQHFQFHKAQLNVER